MAVISTSTPAGAHVRRILAVIGIGLASTVASALPAAAQAAEEPVDCGARSTIESGFNGTSIDPGSWVWFNSHAKIDTLGKSRVFLGVRDASANINGTLYPLPDADITLSTSFATATISWDAGRDRWIVNAPIGDAGKDVFLTGLGIPLPAGLPGGAEAGFNAIFTTNTPGLGLSWQWSAAVYTQLSSNPADLGVLPVDGERQSGTPMNYREFVTGGARGGGGSNFTGSNSATRSVTPPCGPGVPISAGGAVGGLVVAAGLAGALLLLQQRSRRSGVPVGMG